jgi:glutathione S-transferase
MSLALYGHPFSSYTQKVLIALYENSTPFDYRRFGPDTPQHASEWLRRWPLAKFPLLVDGERNVVETSIIIEYLQLAYPGPLRLLPSDPMAALDVRFLDRFFDLHVMTPVQQAVSGALTGIAEKRQEGLALAASKLELAYAWLEGHLTGGAWAAGVNFTMADCAAAPRCSTPTGPIALPRVTRGSVLTVRDCCLAPPSPGRSMRRDRSAHSFRSERRTRTDGVMSETAALRRSEEVSLSHRRALRCS